MRNAASKVILVCNYLASKAATETTAAHFNFLSTTTTMASTKAPESDDGAASVAAPLSSFSSSTLTSLSNATAIEMEVNSNQGIFF